MKWFHESQGGLHIDMRRWKVFWGCLKPNWCTIGDSKHGNKPFGRLPNISKYSITGSVSKKDWAIYLSPAQFTQQYYANLLAAKSMDSIFDSTYHFLQNLITQTCSLEMRQPLQIHL